MPRTSKSRVIYRPVQLQAKSRIDSWQTISMQRRAYSATEVYNKPVVINARSRLDTWQKSIPIRQSNISQIIDRPVQIEGRSRIDSWQTEPLRRRARSITHVGIS